MLIHVDTDLGGDPDDACAIAMLLGWPGVELAGITTTIDRGGIRAGQVAHLLALANCDDVPLAAGAELSMSGEIADPYTDERFWPRSLAPRPSPPGAAVGLLRQNAARGATVAAIGPLTNLAALELAHPGTLATTELVIMGGWIEPAAEGLPTWGPEMDWNIQWDRQAAGIVAAAAHRLTLVTLPSTLATFVRTSDLRQLSASGPLGQLLAAQSEVHARRADLVSLPPANPGLPADLLNFHYDPITCAVAAGWDGVVRKEMRLTASLEGDVFRWRPDDENGRVTSVVTDVDGPRFNQAWIRAVAAAQSG